VNVAAKNLLIELERLTDEAALAIESATQLDKDSSDGLQQVTCDEVRCQQNFVLG
jgi:tRNA-dihydrouridine synthase 2